MQNVTALRTSFAEEEAELQHIIAQEQNNESRRLQGREGWRKTAELANNLTRRVQMRILAIPTLVRKLPPPLRKIIGDLSDTERVLIGLDLKPRS